jgi:hypothetical protein
MLLTPKQEAFAQGLASGLSQSEAYRVAYPKAQSWKDATVWRKASLMAGNGDVQARVDQLRREVAKLNLWTREDSVRVLRDVADSEKGSERVQAVKELNAMHGFNEPLKLDVSGGLNVALVVRGVVPRDADAN